MKLGNAFDAWWIWVLKTCWKNFPRKKASNTKIKRKGERKTKRDNKINNKEMRVAFEGKEKREREKVEAKGDLR